MIIPLFGYMDGAKLPDAANLNGVGFKAAEKSCRHIEFNDFYAGWPARNVQFYPFQDRWNMSGEYPVSESRGSSKSVEFNPHKDVLISRPLSPTFPSDPRIPSFNFLQHFIILQRLQCPIGCTRRLQIVGHFQKPIWETPKMHDESSQKIFSSLPLPLITLNETRFDRERERDAPSRFYI